MIPGKRDALDLKCFLADVEQIATRLKETGGALKSLDRQAKAKFDQFAQQLEQGNVVLNLVAHLKEHD